MPRPVRASTAWFVPSMFAETRHRRLISPFSSQACHNERVAKSRKHAEKKRLEGKKEREKDKDKDRERRREREKEKEKYRDVSDTVFSQFPISQAASLALISQSCVLICALCIARRASPGSTPLPRQPLPLPSRTTPRPTNTSPM